MGLNLRKHPSIQYPSPKRKRGVFQLRPRRTALLLFALTLCSPLHARSPAQANPPVTSTRRISLDELAGAIAEARGELLPLLGRGDLIESLYFGWFDRPYRRATLAGAVKTVAVLQHELKLRQLSNGAIDDDRLGQMIDWLGDFGRRATAPARRPGFRPQQTRIDSAGIQAIISDTDRMAAGPALFGFIDRVTATSHDDWLGDFDPLACMGFRVIGLSSAHRTGIDQRRALLARASALGIAVIYPDGPPADVNSDSNAPVHRPVMIATIQLADFIDPGRVAAPADAHRLRAIADPPPGESWPESLARRALYRGATGHRATVVVGWRPPQMDSVPADLPHRVSAAMWVHALDGQRLALLEGWRDLRDGSSSPYASIALEPAVIEAVASTALDLLHFRNAVDLFDRRPEVAVAVGAECLRPGSTNRWSSDYAGLFAALAARQIRFDVVPQDKLADRGLDIPYRVLVVATAGSLDQGQPPSLARLESAGVPAVQWRPGPGSADGVAAAVEDHLSQRDASNNDLVVRHPGGGGAANLMIFHGRNSAIAIANIAARPTTVRITTTKSHGRTPRLRDALDAQTFGHPDQGIPIGAWQVRVLVPTER